MYLNKMKKNTEDMAKKNPFWSNDNPIWAQKQIDFNPLETLVISPKKSSIISMYANLYDADLQHTYPMIKHL